MPFTDPLPDCAEHTENGYVGQKDVQQKRGRKPSLTFLVPKKTVLILRQYAYGYFSNSHGVTMAFQYHYYCPEILSLSAS
ncbi:hypothetical protein [uncultured Croceitalea sp.]|uniref:hypothetical protein n=1 Tax=uncultured Croceitalea sp. TaxID=1798908 RepID=UPI0033059B9C